MEKIVGSSKTITWPSPTQTPGLVSVIIPALNRAHLLPSTLDSIFAQTYRPVEVVIVDDGSTDGTPEAAEQWAAAHNGSDFTVCVLRRDHRGASAARNAGALQSKGEFIQFFDSDDLMRPEKLAKTIEALVAQPDLGFVTSDYQTNIKKNGTVVTYPHILSDLKKTPHVYIVDRMTVNTHGPIFRRTALAVLGPWLEDISMGDDFEYGFRALTMLQGKWLPEILYDICETPGSLSLCKGKKREWGESWLRTCDYVEKQAHAMGESQQSIQKDLGYFLKAKAYLLAKRKSWEPYEVILNGALCRLEPLERIPLLFHRLAQQPQKIRWEVRAIRKGEANFSPTFIHRVLSFFYKMRYKLKRK